MPIKQCISKGKNGKKWGTSGKCYIGTGAKAKAKKQGQAIKASLYREKK